MYWLKGCLISLKKDSQFNSGKISQLYSTYHQNWRKAIEFADRIISAILELLNMRVTDEMLSKDIHCLSRLKEGLTASNTYRGIAFELIVESNLTWDNAIRSLTFIDSSFALRNMATEGLTLEVLHWVILQKKEVLKVVKLFKK